MVKDFQFLTTTAKNVNIDKIKQSLMYSICCNEYPLKLKPSQDTQVNDKLIIEGLNSSVFKGKIKGAGTFISCSVWLESRQLTRQLHFSLYRTIGRLTVPLNDGIIEKSENEELTTSICFGKFRCGYYNWWLLFRGTDSGTIGLCSAVLRNEFYETFDTIHWIPSNKDKSVNDVKRIVTLQSIPVDFPDSDLFNPVFFICSSDVTGTVYCDLVRLTVDTSGIPDGPSSNHRKPRIVEWRFLYSVSTIAFPIVGFIRDVKSAFSNDLDSYNISDIKILLCGSTSCGLLKVVSVAGFEFDIRLHRIGSRPGSDEFHYDITPLEMSSVPSFYSSSNKSFYISTRPKHRLWISDETCVVQTTLKLTESKEAIDNIGILNRSNLLSWSSRSVSSLLISVVNFNSASVSQFFQIPWSSSSSRQILDGFWDYNEHRLTVLTINEQTTDYVDINISHFSLYVSFLSILFLDLETILFLHHNLPSLVSTDFFISHWIPSFRGILADTISYYGKTIKELEISNKDNRINLDDFKSFQQSYTSPTPTTPVPTSSVPMAFVNSCDTLLNVEPNSNDEWNLLHSVVLLLQSIIKLNPGLYLGPLLPNAINFAISIETLLVSRLSPTSSSLFPPPLSSFSSPSSIQFTSSVRLPLPELSRWKQMLIEYRRWTANIPLTDTNQNTVTSKNPTRDEAFDLLSSIISRINMEDSYNHRHHIETKSIPNDVVFYDDLFAAIKQINNHVPRDQNKKSFLVKRAFNKGIESEEHKSFLVLPKFRLPKDFSLDFPCRPDSGNDNGDGFPSEIFNVFGVNVFEGFWVSTRLQNQLPSKYVPGEENLSTPESFPSCWEKVDNDNNSEHVGIEYSYINQTHNNNDELSDGLEWTHVVYSDWDACKQLTTEPEKTNYNQQSINRQTSNQPTVAADSSKRIIHLTQTGLIEKAMDDDVHIKIRRRCTDSVNKERIQNDRGNIGLSNTRSSSLFPSFDFSDSQGIAYIKNTKMIKTIKLSDKDICIAMNWPSGILYTSLFQQNRTKAYLWLIEYSFRKLVAERSFTSVVNPVKSQLKKSRLHVTTQSNKKREKPSIPNSSTEGRRRILTEESWVIPDQILWHSRQTHKRGISDIWKESILRLPYCHLDGFVMSEGKEPITLELTSSQYSSGVGEGKLHLRNRNMLRPDIKTRFRKSKKKKAGNADPPDIWSVFPCIPTLALKVILQHQLFNMKIFLECVCLTDRAAIVISWMLRLSYLDCGDFSCIEGKQINIKNSSCSSLLQKKKGGTNIAGLECWRQFNYFLTALQFEIQHHSVLHLHFNALAVAVFRLAILCKCRRLVRYHLAPPSHSTKVPFWLRKEVTESNFPVTPYRHLHRIFYKGNLHRNLHRRDSLQYFLLSGIHRSECLLVKSMINHLIGVELPNVTIDLHPL